MKIKFKKKVLSLFMALVLAIPSTMGAFAADDPLIVNPAAATQIPGDKGVVSKEATATTEDDEFEINLKIVGNKIQTTKEVEVILLIDTSGSMNDNNRIKGALL